MSVRTPVRVAIVNDYELVLVGLRVMLLPYRARVELTEAGVGVDTAQGLDVDVVLVDTFGRGCGHESELHGLVAGTDAKVVVYSWVHDPAMIDGVVGHGVAGYLSKGLPAGHLVAGLEAVRDGHLVVSTEDRFVVPGSEAGDWPGRAAGLSHREAEVVAGITRGLTNEEIAASLFLSINSVKTYIRTAYRKIGAERRAQAVVWGIEHGFALHPDEVPRPR